MKRLKKYNKLLVKRILTLKISTLPVDVSIVYGMIKKLKIMTFSARVIMRLTNSKNSLKKILINQI